MAIDILAAGCVTPIGFSLGETAAAARGRVARLREIDWLDRRFEPYIVGTVLDDGLPALADDLVTHSLQAREVRMLRMAHAALADALQALPEDCGPLPLLLGLPEHHTTCPLDPAAFLARLVTQSGAPIDLARSVAVARGRAAGLMALRQAAARLASGEAEYVLVGGVDSLIDLYVLGTLDLEGRIRNAINGDGFSPGEGACFLLLGDPVRRGTMKPLATITACASSHEPGHLYADTPYLGDGLAAAVGELLEATPSAAPIACTYASFNGERYWAREFGVARIRNAARFADSMQMEHPAECFGDLGAAHGPVLAALAAHGLAGGYRPAPCLVYASSDRGDRAAMLLDPAPQPAG
ncbi:MAG: hypothetical protein CVU25_06265 [Betaproteobacteria bacterium HGW-Betaproteobacteria-19]|nr:MAG: hypothetical protein CVU25_06265 [Betaproteobacteria bacterium HGW-Betaproteobacteria-19]